MQQLLFLISDYLDYVMRTEIVLQHTEYITVDFNIVTIAFD